MILHFSVIIFYVAYPFSVWTCNVNGVASWQWSQGQLWTDLIVPKKRLSWHRQNISYEGVGYRRLTFDRIESRPTSAMNDNTH